MLKRRPDFVIGRNGAPYLMRWHLIGPNRFLNLYLHKIIRDDLDGALHDHPWFNVSIVLRGTYREVMPDLGAAPSPHSRIADLPLKSKLRRAGSVIFRRATACHRLEVARGPVWTLFVTGPWRRVWGFHCPQGFRPWGEYVDSDDHGAIGRGCE